VSVRPATILGVLSRRQSAFPGSMRSGLNPTWKSREEAGALLQQGYEDVAGGAGVRGGLEHHGGPRLQPPRQCPRGLTHTGEVRGSVGQRRRHGDDRDVEALEVLRIRAGAVGGRPQHCPKAGRWDVLDVRRAGGQLAATLPIGFVAGHDVSGFGGTEG
jgi:hypothetical protein